MPKVLETREEDGVTIAVVSPDDYAAIMEAMPPTCRFSNTVLTQRGVENLMLDNIIQMAWIHSKADEASLVVLRQVSEALKPLDAPKVAICHA